MTECVITAIDFDVHALECDSAQELADYLLKLEGKTTMDTERASTVCEAIPIEVQDFVDLSIQSAIFYERWFGCIFPRFKRWLFKRKFENEHFELRNPQRWYKSGRNI